MLLQKLIRYLLFIYSIYKVPTLFILFDNPQAELCLLDNCFSVGYQFFSAKEREIISLTSKTQSSTFIFFLFQFNLILDRVKLKHNK